MNAALNIAPTTDQGLIARAAALAPSLRERARRISTERRVPDDVLQDLRDAGLLQVLRPRQYGGREISLNVFYRIVRELSEGDGSTAWVYAVTNSHDPIVRLFPYEIQEEYWSSARPLAASSFSPTGKAANEGGGFRLSGRWSFCSGIDHCGWIVLGGIVGMLEGPPRPDYRLFLVPERDYKIEDDWFVSGLRGTGSKSIVLDNVFVPPERCITGEDVSACRCPGNRGNDNPLYGQPIWTSTNFCIPSPATGIARAAYDQFLEEFRPRAMSGRDPGFETKKPAIQAHLAEVDALLESSELMFLSSLDEHFADVAAGKAATDEKRVKYRRNQAYSVLMARKAAEILLGMAGAKAVLEHHPVFRAVQDLYSVSVHPRGNWDGAALSFGSVALGGSPLEPLI